MNDSLVDQLEKTQKQYDDCRKEADEYIEKIKELKELLKNE